MAKSLVRENATGTEVATEVNKPGSVLAIGTMPESKLVAMIEGALGPTSGVQLYDLEMIKAPSGGGTTWEMTDINGEVTPTRSMEGVIIATRPYRAYYATSFDEAPNSKPTCKSSNMIIGEGDPGGLCAECALNVWGSAPPFKDGTPSDAKACSERNGILFLRTGEYLPVVVDASPGSLKALKQYGLGLTRFGLGQSTVITKIALSKEISKKGITFAALTFAVAGRLSEQDAALVEKYAESTAAMLSQGM